jgi:hypothetical protein
MNVTVAGPDEHGIADAIADAGHQVTSVDVANRPALEDAGLVDADAYVLTEVRQATSIAVARDLADGLKIVVYDADSLPDFARGQADLVVDPNLLDPAAVAAEL